MQGFLEKMEVVTSLSMTEKDFAWFIQQGDKVAQVTLCVWLKVGTVKRSAGITQGREGWRGWKGRRGRKGRRVEGEEDISWTGSLLDLFPALPPTTPFILQTPLFKFVVL